MGDSIGHVLFQNKLYREPFFTRFLAGNGRSMNKCALNSFAIEYEDGFIDVYTEIRKTARVPYEHVLGDENNPEYVNFDAEVFDLIRQYIKDGGYAGLTLAEYLDGFY